MKNRRKQITTWALLSIYCLLGAEVSGGLAFCVSETGHSRLEPVGDQCCDSACPTGMDVCHDTDSHNHSDCGDCDDYNIDELFIGSLRNSHKVTTTPPAALHYFMPPQYLNYFPAKTSLFAATGLSACSQDFLSASVVFLC